MLKWLWGLLAIFLLIFVTILGIFWLADRPGPKLVPCLD